MNKYFITITTNSIQTLQQISGNTEIQQTTSIKTTPKQSTYTHAPHSHVRLNIFTSTKQKAATTYTENQPADKHLQNKLQQTLKTFYYTLFLDQNFVGNPFTVIPPST